MAPTLGSFHQKRCVLGWVGMTGAGGHGALDDGHAERYPYVAGSLLPDCDAPHCRGCRSAHGIAAATYSEGRAMRTEFAAISDGSGRQSLRGLIGSSAPRFRIMTIICTDYERMTWASRTNRPMSSIERADGGMSGTGGVVAVG